MDVDRLAPARRAACPQFATGAQTWRDLLFLHWEAPVAWLRERVPPELEIDTFEGRAFVGIVPFTMHRVRVGPLYLGSFLEMNVRTYVHAGGVPGVWFSSLDCDRRLVVAGARTMFRLPYFRARMSSRVQGDVVDYEHARAGAAERLALRWTIVDSAPHAARPGSLEHFLTERYALYGPRRHGGVYRLRVHHPPWPLYAARIDTLDTNLIDGKPLALVLASREGVRVSTFAKQHDSQKA